MSTGALSSRPLAPVTRWRLVAALALLALAMLLLQPLAVRAAASGAWTRIGNTVVPLNANTLTLLSNGQVLAAGGSGFNDQNSGFASTNVAQLYDPATNTWHATSSMNVARVNPGAVLLPSSKVLVAGGMDAVDDFFPYSTAELYDPTSGAWTMTGSLNHGA